MTIEGYDDWKHGIPVEVVLSHCEECGAEIYLHNEYYKTNKGNVHYDCIEEFSLGCLEAELIEAVD